MKRIHFALCWSVCVIACHLSSAAQQLPTNGSAVIVPQLIRFAGVLRDESGHPLTGIAGVTFSLYRDQEGGAPLWMEIQNVVLDANGGYEVLLGAEHSGGVPMDLFTTGEARWLGVQAQGQGGEQPRVPLVSVPYALKAADASTLNGLPASAFMLAATITAPSAETSSINSTAAVPAGSAPALAPCSSIGSDGAAKANQITKFTAPCNIEGSKISDNGSTASVAELLTLPARGTATASAGWNSQALNWTASAFNIGVSKAVPQNFRLQAEAVNNDTANASATLNLLFGQGTAIPAETGLRIGSNGRITFAPGQTFPGTGSGTVKSVGLAAPASDFIVSGSPVTGSGTLSLGWNVAPTNSNTANAIVKRDASGSFNANNIASIGTISVTTANANGLLVNSSGVGAVAAQINATAVTGQGGGLIATTVNPNTNSFGVWGQANGPSNGVGVTEGVVGTSTAPAGIGVLGYVGTNGTSDSFNGDFGNGAPGVWGDAGRGNSTGAGVIATNDDGNALIGINNSHLSPTLAIVNATTFTDGLVFAAAASSTGAQCQMNTSGNLFCTGGFSGASQNFRIDHPLDPGNRFLIHTAVESPDRKTIYDGMAVLDANGEAVVKLPAYFEALNGAFRYQLTCIGGYAPVYVAKEIEQNEFRIAGGKAGMKVSWQVTGIRHDAWSKANPTEVEVEKPGEERGHYLHPAAFGRARDKSIPAVHSAKQSLLHSKAAQGIVGPSKSD